MVAVLERQPDLRIERTAEGEIIIMAPVGGSIFIFQEQNPLFWKIRVKSPVNRCCGDSH